MENTDNVELYASIRDNKTIYAVTTFSRAVPYVKDGLIEAYRRSMYDMINKKIRSNSKTVKSALIVGDVIGRFHPHGDGSAYQAIVTQSQPWTNNYPLIYGKGNWGNVLGKPAAHYRYTECKLSEFFDDVCEDIKEEYVDFVPNFDGSDQEVSYIPFKIPVVLINGSYGIADSYMTSILPHNLNDVADMCIRYINDKNIRNYELTDGFFPDFPNYGIILNKDEIERCYKFNVQGNVKMKATLEINREENKIVIKDLPYNVTEDDIKESLKTYHTKQHAVLSKVLNIFKVDTVRDGNPHIEFDVQFDKNANILEVARDLEKHCLSKTIPINNIMYDRKYVKKVSIKDIIEHWYDTIYTTKMRKINYHQSVIANETHIIEGKVKIYDHVDPIIEFAKKSKSESEFLNYLISNYGLTPIQAKAIMRMQIQQLSRTSKEEMFHKIAENNRKIAELDGRLTKIDEEIIADLEKLKAKYGRPRRTVIMDQDELTNKNVTSIPMSNGVVLWSRNQFAIFDINNVINGKSIMNGVKTVKVDGRAVKEIVGCHNIKRDLIGIILFQTDGTARRIPVQDIVGINHWISVSDDPIISAILPIYSDDDKYIAISENNKIKISSVETFTRNSAAAGKVKCAKQFEPQKKHCLIISNTGRYHFIDIADIPEVGRNASGVLTNFKDDEELSFMQMEHYSDDVGLCSLVDSEGYSYIMKIEQDLLEETSRTNKPRKLFDLNNQFSITNLNWITLKDKDTRCIMIGRNSTTQVSIINLRSSDLTRVPKKIPVNALGLILYKL